jgi:hypothetical protein
VQQPALQPEVPAPSQREVTEPEPEPAPQQGSEIQEPPAPQETATTQILEPQLKKDDSARIVDLQTAYYFSDRFVLKNRQSASFAVRGDYQTFPNTSESTQILNVGVDLYNIKILKSYFDLSAGASSSEQLAENYYHGSLTWHHSPYASIDVSYKSTENDAWYSQYDVAHTSLGINGYYKSQGVGFQFGAGVRFQVDYGDFNTYFADLVEKNYRYLQSFYLLGSTAFGTSTAAFMAGVINESIYASVSFLFFKYIGVNYTFKNKSMENSYFTPLEQELKHQLSLYINLTLKNRERY